MWHSATQRGTETFEQHAYQLVREIVKQAKLPASRSLQDNEADKLDQLVNHLSQSEFIIDATLYSTHGQQVAQSKDALPIGIAVGLSQSEEKAKPRPSAQLKASMDLKTRQDQVIKPNLFPIVEVIIKEGKTLGYVRVTFDYDAVQKHSKDFQEGYSDLSRLMLFIAGLIGVLFARAFAKQ